MPPLSKIGRLPFFLIAIFILSFLLPFPVSAKSQLPEPVMQGEQQDFLQSKWTTGLWGESIGMYGLRVLDLDHDGAMEVITAQRTSWQISSYSQKTHSLEFEWLSPASTDRINQLTVADTKGNQTYQVYVVRASGLVEVYQADPPKLLDTFHTPFGKGQVYNLVVADVQNDGINEIVMGTNYYDYLSESTYTGIAVLNADD